MSAATKKNKIDVVGSQRFVKWAQKKADVKE